MQRKVAKLHQTLRVMKRISKSRKMRKDNSGGHYSEEKDEGKMTLRLFLEKILVSKSYGIYVEGLMFFASLLSTLGYIIITYSGSTPTWFNVADFCICAVFALEYLLFFYISQQRLSYIFSADTLIDLYIFSSIFVFSFVDWGISSLFISCSRLLRVTKISRILKQWLQIGDNNVNSQIFTIGITIFTIIYFFAGLLQLVENMYMPEDLPRYQFHDMIYFVVVTLTTVGYGDIVPQTIPGEFAVVVIIFMVIVLIPKQSSDLLMLIDLQSPYARAMYKSNPEIPHLIICGNASVLALKTFCSELLHPDHGVQDKNAVILDESVPSSEMELLLHDPQYEVYLTYLQGNPMIDRDLERSSANKAKLCVIFTDKSTRDPIAADHKNILTALAIKQQVYYENRESLRVCVQIMKPESQTHYFSTLNIQTAEPRDHLIIVEEVKMNLMAKSCFSPGIIGLVSNLVATSGDFPGCNEAWINEYTQGMNFELYRTEVPHIFKGKTFLEVVKIVYFQLKAIVIGWEKVEGNRPVVMLNPGVSEICDTKKTKMYLYLMCKDKDTADQIAEIKYTAEYGDPGFKSELPTYNTKLGKCSPDEEEKEEMDTDDYHEEVQDSKSHFDEPLTNERFYLDNGEGTCEIKDTIQDSKDIVNHIVVCGMHSSMRYFLNTMRAKYLKQCPYIVILSAKTMPHQEWEAISKFSKIIYIQGSPLLEEDLLRANVHRASRAVVLEIDQRENEEITDEMRDAQTIFIYKALKKCNPSLQVTVELIESSNIGYLLPKSQVKDYDRFDLSPIFASGEVYISTVIDTLSCQAYYNPHIIAIVHQLLTGGSISGNQQGHQSNLWQISVPEEYVNEPFKELFVHLLTHNRLVALGLYRLPGATDNTYAYVYTNPDPDCILTSHDRVFVIGAEVSSNMLVSLNTQAQIDYRSKFLKECSGTLDVKGEGTPTSAQTNMDHLVDKQKEITKTLTRTENQYSTELTQIIKELNGKLEDIEEQIKEIKTKFGAHEDDIKRTVQSTIMQKLKALTF